MTPFRKRLTPITKRMAEDMLLRNMSVRSIDTYTYHVDRFAKHFGKQPEDLGPEEIRGSGAPGSGQVRRGQTWFSVFRPSLVSSNVMVV